MKAVALIALTCLALTACGGDDNPSTGSGSGSSNNGGSGGTGSTGSGGNGSGGSGGSGGSTLTWRYEATTPASDGPSFLTLLNSEGAKGYRYLGDYYYDASNGGSRSIFVNDGTAPTYTYQLQSAPGDWATFLNQASTQGTNGYRYEGPLAYGYLYRKDGGSSATYTYATATLPASQDAFVTQANGQGQSGYWFVGPMMVGSAQANLYMKNNASGSTYTYDALIPPTGVNDFIAQANSEGAKGYRVKGGMSFGPANPTGAINVAWVYVKDQTQSPTFTYQSAAIQSTGAGFVQQSNNYGAQGSAYLGDLALGTTTPVMASFYLKPTNCTGFLCTTLNPLTQN
ncbi:hypothetical protein [Burkholderia pyrrocinia]|uniref:hypothetical protein n=1 Tax=Burkholderia pyrrocinia TaxID=60550 RepID=UPI001BCD859F|nr:hypothetical protein [Burkholderia pyrrocinia]QVN20179.1 hypothetical protein JYG32_26645 [Burkholderia pyrrocinia]